MSRRRQPQPFAWDFRLSFAHTVAVPGFTADVLGRILLRNVHVTVRQDLAMEDFEFFTAARAAGEPYDDTVFLAALRSLAARCLLTSQCMLNDYFRPPRVFVRGVYLRTLDAVPEINPYVPHLYICAIPPRNAPGPSGVANRYS